VPILYGGRDVPSRSARLLARACGTCGSTPISNPIEASNLAVGDVVNDIMASIQPTTRTPRGGMIEYFEPQNRDNFSSISGNEDVVEPTNEKLMRAASFARPFENPCEARTEGDPGTSV